MEILVQLGVDVDLLRQVVIERRDRPSDGSALTHEQRTRAAAAIVRARRTASRAEQLRNTVQRTDEERQEAARRHERFVVWVASQRPIEPPMVSVSDDGTPRHRCAFCGAEYILGTVLCAECLGTDLPPIDDA